MKSLALPAGNINWNGGQRITLTAGQTATCTVLQPGQLYAIYAYNSAGNDNNANLTVVWSNSQPPVSIVVPGTTGNAGLAALGFVSGSDTQTISVSLPTGSNITQLEIWLGSVSMPINTSGLSNNPLPFNGLQQSFNKYTRYYAVPPSQWVSVTISSVITQFISVQFTEAAATVFVVNETSNGLLPGQVTTMGPTASAPGAVTILPVTYQSVTKQFQGSGAQFVWIDADSQQDSQSATIAAQLL